MTPQFHVCLSGSLACSALSPCPPCHAFLMRRILPRGEVAAGLNGSMMAFIHDVVAALGRQNVHPSQLGLQVPAMFASVEAQSQAFEVGCNEAWRELHAALRDPRVVAELGVKMTDVGKLLAASQQPRETVSQQPREAAASQQPREAASQQPLAGENEMPVAAPPAAAPSTPKPVDEKKLAADRERARELVRPMDAEDIAAAGLPVEELAVVDLPTPVLAEESVVHHETGLRNGAQ